jgi:hypothetical protein
MREYLPWKEHIKCKWDCSDVMKKNKTEMEMKLALKDLSFDVFLCDWE